MSQNTGVSKKDSINSIDLGILWIRVNFWRLNCLVKGTSICIKCLLSILRIS